MSSYDNVSFNVLILL